MLVLLDLIHRNKFLSILQFLGNLLQDFLGRAYLFGPDLPIDLLDVAETSVRFKLLIDLNFSPQLLPQLNTISAVPFSLLGRPSQLSVQGFCGDFLCLLANAQRFDFDLSSLLTQTRKKT